jgi:hypothetical protein
MKCNHMAVICLKCKYLLGNAYINLLLKRMKLVEDFIFVRHEIHPSFLRMVVNEVHKVLCSSLNGTQKGPHSSKWIRCKILMVLFLVAFGNLTHEIVCHVSNMHKAY